MSAPDHSVTRKVDFPEVDTRLFAVLDKVEQEKPKSEWHARRDLKRLLRWYIVTDALALLLGNICAWGLATVINNVLYNRALGSVASDGDILRMVQYTIIAAGTLLWFGHTGHYAVRMPFWLETKKIVSTLFLALIIDGFLQFASKTEFSRLWLVSSWVIGMAAVVIMRAVYRQMRRQEGAWQIPTLLVGAGPTAENTQAALHSEPALGYQTVGQIENLPAMFAANGYSWEALCNKYEADYVVIALDGPELSEAEMALAQLMRERIPFSVAPPLRHMPVLGMIPQYFFNHDTMLLMHRNRLEQPLPRSIKRSFDLVAGSLALLVLALPMAIIALLIKNEGGSIFYKQLRLGLNGKQYNCYKFRSMAVNSDEVLTEYFNQNPAAKTEWAAYRKLRNHDPRITKIGGILRRTSLDELPQLWNVLRGDMSLVGPRPILFEEMENYRGDIAHYCRVRPGITGLWQVSGRSNVSVERRVQMDSWYVRNWSLWHDIAIICKTIPVLWNRTGAY